MKVYSVLQIIVFSYTAISAIFAILSIFFEVKSGFKPVQAKYQMFTLLNKLHGKTTILLPFRIFSVVALISWLALALPWIDTFIGTHWISTLNYGSFHTWFGEFVGKQGDYYFMTVFIGILAVKGFWVCKRMADILTDDHIAVSKIGLWGARKDFK